MKRYEKTLAVCTLIGGFVCLVGGFTQMWTVLVFGGAMMIPGMVCFCLTEEDSDELD